MSEKQRVLILCTGNVARSQMAEGLLRHMAGDRFEVFSAGLLPSYVRPNAIAVMNELGIDISHHRSKSLDEFLDTPFDFVITVCDHANQHCPVFPGAGKADPLEHRRSGRSGGSEEAQLEAFRRARDELQRRIQSFVDDLAK